MADGRVEAVRESDDMANPEPLELQTLAWHENKLSVRVPDHFEDGVYRLTVIPQPGHGEPSVGYFTVTVGRPATRKRPPEPFGVARARRQPAVHRRPTSRRSRGKGAEVTGFSVDCARLSDTQQRAVADRVSTLPPDHVTIYGFCDCEGTSSFNWRLGALRGNAVARILHDSGYGGSVTVKSCGKEFANANACKAKASVEAPYGHVIGGRS